MADRVEVLHCPDCDSHCPGVPAIPLSALEEAEARLVVTRDLLRRYREAHRSMALVAQEAGASEDYRNVTEEVDRALSQG